MLFLGNTSLFTFSCDITTFFALIWNILAGITCRYYLNSALDKFCHLKESSLLDGMYEYFIIMIGNILLFW